MKSFKLFVLEHTCTTCGEEFNVRRHKMGFVGQCDECGREAEQERGVSRHVGMLGGAGVNKSAAISIFKNPSDAMRAKVQTLNKNMRVGGGLGISSTAPAVKKNEPK